VGRSTRGALIGEKRNLGKKKTFGEGENEGDLTRKG